jgi:hypothetical protein
MSSYKYEYMDDLIKTERFATSQVINDIDDFNLDRGYNKIMMPVSFIINKKVKKKIKSLVYFSSIRRIRHAVSGIYTNDIVGLKEESFYFKVKNTNPTTSKGETREYPLFYHSPEEFENHFTCTLSKKVKQAWYDKKNNSAILAL